MVSLVNAQPVPPEAAPWSLEPGPGLDVLIAREYSCVESRIFDDPHAVAELLRTPDPPLPVVRWYQPTREGNAAGRLQVSVLMTADEERTLFLRFNYCRKTLIQLQAQMRVAGAAGQLAQQFLAWHKRSEYLREYLVRANLALVMAMARRTRLVQFDAAEIISEGNVALLRAVDAFSVDHGVRFSTYACRAILRALSRTSIKHAHYRQVFPVEFDPDLEEGEWTIDGDDHADEDDLDQIRQIVNNNLADLSRIEQMVIRQRFNWEQTGNAAMTLQEIGSILGVTRERVRQIQNKALAKVRTLLTEPAGPSLLDRPQA